MSGFEAWVEFYNLCYAFSLSYVVAFIFYYVVTIVPEKKARKHISPYIGAVAKKMLFHCEHIAIDLLREENAINKDYSKIDIYKMLKNIRFSTPTPKARCSFSNGEQMKVYESITLAISEVKESSNELYKNIAHVDSELIKIINSICNGTIGSDSIIDNWPKPVSQLDISHINRNEPLHTHYACSLHEHIKNTKKLKAYCFKNIPKIAKDYFVDMHTAFENKNWKNFQSVLCKVKELDKHDRNALYYESKYYVELKQYEKAIECFLLALEEHPNLLFNIVSDYKSSSYSELNTRDDYLELINNVRYKSLLPASSIESLYAP